MKLAILILAILCSLALLKIYSTHCGEFEYYVKETNKCVPFRNYEQEARYKGIIN